MSDAALLTRMQALADHWEQQALSIFDVAMDMDEDDPHRAELEAEVENLRYSAKELRLELERWQVEKG